MVLPPYSRQTAPSEVHHPLLQVDLQEDEAFHNDGALRAFPFYRLNDVQKEVYRLLSATDPAAATVSDAPIASADTASTISALPGIRKLYCWR